MGLKSSLAHTSPPSPEFNEGDIPALDGKVYIDTGSNTGIGKEVARLLYTKNAKVAHPFLMIPPQRASSHKSRGSMVCSTMPGSWFFEPLQKTVQGYEVTLGVNCVGTFLFTKLLTPALAATAKASLLNRARIIWLSSFACELRAHEGVGLSTDNLDYHTPVIATTRYGLSKSGGVGSGRRVRTPPWPWQGCELQRDQSWLFKFLTGLLLYPTINGVWTELYAAFSPEVPAADLTENWVGPFGRILPLRPDLPKATKLESEAGTGGTAKFWDWNKEQVKDYV
ncbi:putative short-chain dehydrogenase [Seiridium cardinale]|uniref:Short-chain dehydrogenase n=1 Tax=Seiridium cardinale TaxID=138064 RepID=A0ABR2XMN8_9PEZI